MKRGFTLLEVIFVLVVAVVLVALLFPLTQRHQPPGRSICQSNLKQVGLAIAIYIQDYDETYPPAPAPGQIWPVFVQDYLGPQDIFECPTGDERTARRATGPLTGTDYFLNARFHGLEQSFLEASALTVLNGEGENEMDALSYNQTIVSIPSTWMLPDGPARRHLDGSNFAFADGHVKWYPSTRIPTNAAGDIVSGKASFRVK